MSRLPPEGASFRIERPQLQELIDHLQAANYRTLGPQISQGAVIYADLTSVEQLPQGYVDEQDGGRYRLRQSGDAWFDYTVGPHSLKNFLFPPRETLVQLERIGGEWETTLPEPDPQPLAVIGPRSCDLQAMAIQDRVFLGSGYVDPGYQRRRESLLVVAVNCRRAVATCFCHSMQTGPVCTGGYDLVLTEVEETFVVTIGSTRGAEIVSALQWEACDTETQQAAEAVREQLIVEFEGRSTTSAAPATDEPRPRTLETAGIRELLMSNLEHSHWDEVAQKCLACTNCTLVCPTCFCSSVQEVTDLEGDHVQRERAWDSCFTMEHSQMSFGPVRKSIASRYRQWLTHKLATWQDQFDSSGCVGCGRCITWCPVGIDLTEEVAALRESTE